MKVSKEEAHNLIRKWEEESSLLRVVCGGKQLGVDFFGRIEDASTDDLHIVWEGGQARISILDAEFVYAEPGEASELVRESEEASCVSQLRLYWPSGHAGVFFERR